MDTPLANLAMGNIFFILQGLSCSKSPPNGFPARSSTKNAFLNRAVLLKLIRKKAKNQFWARGKLLHWSLGDYEPPTQKLQVFGKMLHCGPGGRGLRLVPLANLAMGNIFSFYMD